jgi:hypothetical protein
MRLTFNKDADGFTVILNNEDGIETGHFANVDEFKAACEREKKEARTRILELNQFITAVEKWEQGNEI